MKHTNKHLTLLIFAIITMIITIVVYVYMYRMINVSISEAAADQEILKSNTTNNNDDYIAKYKVSALRWERLPGFFLDADREVDFIEILEGLGPKSGSKITLDSINSDDIKNKPLGTEGRINAKISATGSWQAVMGTLSLIESLPYKISVGEVYLDQGGVSKGEKSEWKLSLNIAASILDQNEASTTAR